MDSLQEFLDFMSGRRVASHAFHLVGSPPARSPLLFINITILMYNKRQAIQPHRRILLPSRSTIDHGPRSRPSSQDAA